MANLVKGDQRVTGRLIATYITYPDESIGNDAINSGDPLSPVDSIITRHNWGGELFGPAVTVAALTKLIGKVDTTAVIRNIEALVVTKTTGADRHVFVDLQKSTGGGAFATILTGTIDIDNTAVDLVAEAGTLSNSALVADDLLRLVITVSGAAGAQALGLFVKVVVDENPN